MNAPGRTEREAAFLLLVLQAGVGLLTAAAPILLAVSGAPADLVIGLLAVLVSLGELLLAVLLLRGSRRAATWLAGYQAVCLTGANLAVLAHLGSDNHLAALATNLAIPVLLLVLLLHIRETSPMPAASHPSRMLLS
jgi:hypothetical protein